MRGLLRLAALVALLAAPRLAAAAPSDVDRASARELMRRGYDALDHGDPKRAAEAFRAAEALVHLPTPAFALARASLVTGDLVGAQEALVRLSRMPVEPGEPAEFAQVRAEGAKMLQGLDARIPALQVEIVGVAADQPLTARLDGAPVPREALGFPFRVNPGKHTVTAESDARTAKAEVTLVEGEKRMVRVELERPAPPASAPVPPPPERPATRESGVSPLAYVGLAVGAAGLATGAVTGVLAIGAKNQAVTNGCTSDGRCPPSAQSDFHRAQTLAIVADVAFVVAAVGATVAIIAFVWRRSPPSSAPRLGGLAF
jgi:hypothetical protein